MNGIDPEKLMAYVDGELGAAEHAEVERAVAADPALRAEVEAQRRLRSTLRGHYGPVAEEEVPERLRAMLGAGDDPQDANVASLAKVRASRLRMPRSHELAAIAATLVVGFLAGQMVPRGRSVPVIVEQGPLFAEGPLAASLESQLASTQPADTPIRIGLTFADTNGRACRTFEAPSFAGLACRDSGQWQLVMTDARWRATGEYRQAASPAVAEAAQSLMAGSPLDADGERAAQTAGWDLKAAPAGPMD
jgi:hypothetical protein